MRQFCTFNPLQITFLHMIPIMKNLASCNKRSLLPFVGKFASILFCLATSSDVRTIADNLNALHNNSNK